MDFPVHAKRNADGCLRPRLMQAGDLVILYERHDCLDHFYLEAGSSFTNRFGFFPHNDMIGKPFGSRIYSKNIGGGYVYLLEPTPELWGQAMKTRTQIVNDLDCSVVTLMLDVKPGDVVVESGTGSGSMTISLARAVYPTGHVYTYEYNTVRAKMAAEEFTKLKLSDVITVTNRDIYGKSQGAGEAEHASDENIGGFSGVEDGRADAVFLDVPEPWLALHHTFRVLRPGKTLCCYSPCIEQVMKTCEKMRALGFHSLRTIEVRQRPYDARAYTMETLDLGLESAEAEAENARSGRDPQNLYQEWTQRSHQQKDQTSCSAEQKTDNNSHNQRQDTSDAATAEAVAEEEQVAEEDAEHQHQEKKRKVDTTSSESAEVDSEEQSPANAQEEHVKPSPYVNLPRAAVNGQYTMHIGRPLVSMKGHTAFLTFAVRPLR